jgi:hypothetical protein
MVEELWFDSWQQISLFFIAFRLAVLAHTAFSSKDTGASFPEGKVK